MLLGYRQTGRFPFQNPARHIEDFFKTEFYHYGAGVSDPAPVAAV
jgi:hypothetical protein